MIPIKKQHGISLIEWSIASALSILLIIYMLDVLATINIQYQTRQTIDHITKDQLLLGQLFRQQFSAIQLNLCPNTLQRKQIIPDAIKNKWLANQSHLLLPISLGNYATLTRPSQGGKKITVTNNLTLKAHQTLLLSHFLNCKIIKPASIQTQRNQTILLLTKKLNYVYPTHTLLLQTHRWLYYLAPGSHQQTGLFQTDLFNIHQPAELVSGIIQFRVRYGRITQRQIHWQTSVKNWQDIDMVKIDVLLKSLGKIANTPRFYRFLGQQYPNLDHHYYASSEYIIRLQHAQTN